MENWYLVITGVLRPPRVRVSAVESGMDFCVFFIGISNSVVYNSLGVIHYTVATCQCEKYFRENKLICFFSKKVMIHDTPTVMLCLFISMYC